MGGTASHCGTASHAARVSNATRRPTAARRSTAARSRCARSAVRSAEAELAAARRTAETVRAELARTLLDQSHDRQVGSARARARSDETRVRIRSDAKAWHRLRGWLVQALAELLQTEKERARTELEAEAGLAPHPPPRALWPPAMPSPWPLHGASHPAPLSHFWTRTHRGLGRTTTAACGRFAAHCCGGGGACAACGDQSAHRRGGTAAPRVRRLFGFLR